VPLTCNFDKIVRRIEQSDRTAAQRKDPGGKTERGREYFLVRLATLQQLTHLGQERGPLRALLQCLHHLFVVFIERPAGEVFFPLLLLQAGIGVGQFFRTLFNLVLKDLLVVLLLLAVSAGSKPLQDDSLVVAQGDGPIEKPAITVGRIVETVLDFESLARAHAFLPLLLARSAVIGRNGFHPAFPQAVALRHPCHLMPTLIDERRVAIRVGDPNDLRDGLGESLKTDRAGLVWIFPL